MNKKRLPRTIVLATLSLLELALPMKSELSVVDLLQGRR